MSNRAKYLGAVGTVIDGRLRDLQEHRDIEYPVRCTHKTRMSRDPRKWTSDCTHRSSLGT